jgi:hypothetical protein
MDNSVNLSARILVKVSISSNESSAYNLHYNDRVRLNATGLFFDSRLRQTYTARQPPDN